MNLLGPNISYQKKQLKIMKLPACKIPASHLVGKNQGMRTFNAESQEASEL